MLEHRLLIVAFFLIGGLKGQLLDTGKFQPVYITSSNYKVSDSLLSVTSRIEIQSDGNTLASELSKIPGLQSYNMGPGNNKISIRGFSGNRVSLIVDGLKIDNQQWQDEHGLGIIPFSNDEINVGFGPGMSNAIGESIGGQVNIETRVDKTSRSLGFQFHSNTTGGSLSFSKNRVTLNHSNWSNITISDFGDYRDAKAAVAYNSRYRQFQFKLGKMENLNPSTSIQLNLRGYISQTGIARISDSIELNQVKLSEPRDYEGPNHLVSMVLGSSKISKSLQNQQKISHTFGIIGNTRLELEDNKPQGLAMQLVTVQNILRFENNGNSWLNAVEYYNSLQRNINFGSQKAIPNYFLIENRLLLTAKIIPKWKNLGIRLGLNHQKTQVDFSTLLVNRFSKNLSVFLTKSIGFWSAVIRISHSERVPNAHEFFAQGFSEDAFRYDLGNANLKNETLNQLDVAFSIRKKRVQFLVRGFVGNWNHFTSLLPNSTYQNGAPVFEYAQFSGSTIGFESSTELSLGFAKSTIRYDIDCVHYGFYEKLPFIPPVQNKIVFCLNKEQGWKKGIPSLTVEIQSSVLQQPYFEIDKFNRRFTLIHIGIEHQLKQAKYFIQIKNATNTQFIDPMSMLKTIPYYAMGMNIQMGTRILF